MTKASVPPDARPWVAAAEPLVLGIRDLEDRVEMLALLAAAKQAVGDQAAADRCFELAIVEARALPEASVNAFRFAAIAKYQNAVGRRRDAVKALEEGLGYVLRARAKAGRPTDSSVSELVRQAALAGDMPLALRAAEVHRDARNHNLELQGLAARTLRQHGMKADALAALKDFDGEIRRLAFTCSPDHTVHSYFTAIEFAQLGDLQSAAERLKNPQGPPLKHDFHRAEVAGAYLLLDRTDEARAILQEIADPYWNIRAYLQAGEPDEALRLIAQLPPSSPDDEYRGWHARLAIADLLWNRDRRSEAVRIVQQVLDEVVAAPESGDPEADDDNRRWYYAIAAHFGVFDRVLPLVDRLPDEQRARALLECALEASNGVRYCPAYAVGIASCFD